MTVDMAVFRRTFFEESLEGVDLIEQGLLGLEGAADRAEAINAVFRAAHSIKGGAGTFGLTRVASFTHVLETRLDEVRDGRRSITPDLLEAFLQSADAVRALLHATKAEQPHDEAAVQAVEARLNAFGDEPAGNGGPAAAVVAPAATAVSATKWTIDFRPHGNLFASGNDPFRILRELRVFGEVETTADVSRLPALDVFEPETCYLAWRVTLTPTATVDEAALRELFAWVADECDLAIAPVEAATAQPERRSGTDRRGAAAPAAADTASIRVNTDKVDTLVNLVGELVITQSMLSQIAHNFEIDRLGKLLEGLSQLERNTRELQENVMRIRMVPIAFAFSRFPRMVHDICRSLGKQVDLRISGEQTELDKTVIERMVDPLVHLVRNALDHGIETAAERASSSKPATGVLSLHAFHRGSEIVIEVTDDGRGLDRARILSKAVEKGLARADEALSDDRVFSLIFEPGFSTAAAVTDLSGRGVGMDVVRRNITALGGGIDVRSTPGTGTTISIRLPLTLAILDGQLVRVGRQVYVMPLASIVESLKVASNRMTLVAGRAEVYRVRDELIPVLRLARALGAGADTGSIESGLLMVVEADGRRAGLLVDELLAQQQVVIKSLETNYRAIPGIGGATILGDGEVALILDAPGLVQAAHRPGTSLAA